MSDDADKALRRLERRLERERGKVAELERIIEDKTRLLFEANQQLEARVEQRTLELSEALTAAERAGEARKHFLAHMSHELRTPLTGVIGVADLLRRTTLDETQRAHVETIIESGRHLVGLIGRVLDFSKVDAGKLELERAAVDIRYLLETTVQTLRVSAEAKGLYLELEVSPQIPAALQADATRLRQIITNLVGNALRFTEVGGVRVTVDAIRRGDTHLLAWAVEDTGVGIPPDKREHIFDAFAQAEAATSRRFGGTGLGLAITKQLVALMGGELCVDSTVGEGSRFHFTTHHGLADGTATKQRSARYRPEVFSPLRVLVVDDHEVNLSVAAGMLDLVGCRYTTASGGAAALEAFRAANAKDDPFDVVLLDCHMPDMTGYEVARRLRACGARQPILAATADASAENTADVLAAGMDDILPKPFAFEELLTALGKALEFEPSPPDEDPMTTDTADRQDTRRDVPHFDVDDSLDRLGGSKALLAQIARVYLETADELIDALDGALARDEADRRDAVKRAIHTIKGASASVGAARLAAFATELDAAPETIDTKAARRLRARNLQAKQAIETWLATDPEAAAA